MKNSTASQIEPHMPKPAKTLSGVLPWSKACFVCGEDNPHGLHLKSHLNNGVVTLEYTTQERDLGWRSTVHGGITMTLLDEVMTWAAMVHAGKACVSAEITTRMKQQVLVHQKLRAEGRVSAGKGKLINTEAVLLNTEGKVLASATGKYLPMPESLVTFCETDFQSTPDTIPISKVFHAQGKQHNQQG